MFQRWSQLLYYTATKFKFSFLQFHSPSFPCRHQIHIYIYIYIFPPISVWQHSSWPHFVGVMGLYYFRQEWPLKHTILSSTDWNCLGSLNLWKLSFRYFVRGCTLYSLSLLLIGIAVLSLTCRFPNILFSLLSWSVGQLVLSGLCYCTNGDVSEQTMICKKRNCSPRKTHISPVVIGLLLFWCWIYKLVSYITSFIVLFRTLKNVSVGVVLPKN